MYTDISGEVQGQPERLAAFAAEKLVEMPGGSLLVGAGDSYIAGRCTALLSSFRCLSLDPYVLIASPELSRGRTVAFISVSGRTRSNVAAARRVRRLARRTIAVTASAESALARSTDETLQIPFPYRPRMPGTLSFTLSLVAALRLAAVDCRRDFRRLYQEAEKASQQVRFSNGGTTFFLGNHADYEVSLYAAAKVYEFFGGRAQAELLEEFSHLELFSLRSADAVNVFLSADPSGAGPRLVAALRRNGYEAASFGETERAETMTDAVFRNTFLVQLAVMERMKSRKLSVPYFMKSRKKLDVSDSMIY